MRNSLFVLLWVMVGCTNIDCPLDNVVEMTCGLYKAEDESSFTLNTEMSVLSSNSPVSYTHLTLPTTPYV